MKLLSAVLTAAALALSSGAHADSPAPSTLSEGFDDISSLSGWAMVNASSPVPGQGWFQGNDGIFPAFSGAADSYIGASYLASDDPAGYVDLWLLSPVMTVTAATQVSYAIRSAGEAGYIDSFQVLFGTGSDPSGYVLLTHHGSIPSTWESFSAGVLAASEGRFAFRFMGAAAEVNYMGLDSVAITTPVPEPATYIMLCVGLAVLLGFRHSRAAIVYGSIAVSSAACAGEPRASVPPHSGMLVVRDPQSGDLRPPTEAEFRALTELAASLQAGQPAAPPKTIVRPDGTLQRSMGAEGMIYSVVSRGKDGKLSIDCVTGEQAAKEAAGKKESGHEIQ